jgi:hypothetical protein
VQEALGSDGVHYTPISQQLIYEGLKGLIAAHYPELM